MEKMSFPFVVSTNGGELRGTIRLIDAVQVERRFRQSVSTGEKWPLDWLMYGAWCSLRRDGIAVDDDYDKWLLSCEGFDVLDDEDPKSSAKDPQPEPSQ